MGSAWGPGGLAARLNRHLTGRGKKRWHIDYLRELAQPTAVWLAPGAHLECTWAQMLCNLPYVSVPIPGFGASDCRCPTHLFLVKDIPLDQITLPNAPVFMTFPEAPPVLRGKSFREGE